MTEWEREKERSKIGEEVRLRKYYDSLQGS